MTGSIVSKTWRRITTLPKIAFFVACAGSLALAHPYWSPLLEPSAPPAVRRGASDGAGGNIIAVRLTDFGITPNGFELVEGDYTFIIQNRLAEPQDLTVTVTHVERNHSVTRTLPAASDVVVRLTLLAGTYTIADAARPDRARQFVVRPANP